MHLRITLCAAVLTTVAAPGSAQTLTAVCSSPTGWTVGYETGAAVSDTDGFRNANFTYTWKVGTRQGTVITQSSSAAGGSPSTETAAVISSLEAGFVSFVVVFEHALWVHSIYPKPGLAMISRHNDGRGPATGSAAGGLFHAKCRTSMQ